jgi:hypothetical protein
VSLEPRERRANEVRTATGSRRFGFAAQHHSICIRIGGILPRFRYAATGRKVRDPVILTSKMLRDVRVSRMTGRIAAS